MAKELTQQQINEIVENTLLKLQQKGIEDEETIRKVITEEISSARKSSQEKLRFKVEDLVKEISQETSAPTESSPAPKIDFADLQVQDKITPSPKEEPQQKISAKQTAAEVAKNYLDTQQEEHHHNNRTDREDVKVKWSIRADRKKPNSVDDNKELKDWQRKLLKSMNKPMGIMDKIVNLFGKSFEPIFCIIFPILAMIFPVIFLATGFLNSVNEFVTWAFYAIFLFFLLFLPKVASAIEFPILGIYVVCKSGFLRSISPAFADFIDPSGWLTYAPGAFPQQTFTGYAVALGWLTVIFAGIFLLFKIIFFIYLKLKQYRRRYMVRHHHRKRYVASLDKNSEVLM